MKKIPLRKCIVKRISLPKEDLLRIVKNKDNIVSIDLNGNLPGRGCYLSKEIEVIKIATKKRLLDRALKIKVDESIYQELVNLVERR